METRVTGSRVHVPSPRFPTMEYQYDITAASRPALELYFGFCLACTERRGNCTCHDDGKGTD